MVGQLLEALKELGLAENTIVMYSTDNGAEKFTWPDGGQSPFRGEKNTNWEGGYRVPRRDPLARRHQARHGAQRHLRARRHAADAARRRGRPGREGEAAEGHEGRQQDLQGASRRLQHHRRARRQVAEPAHGVLLLQRRRLAGRPALRPVEDRLRRAARRTAWTSGRSRSCRCACPSSSTCAPIRSRPPTTRAWTTSAGGSSTSSCWCRRSSTSGIPGDVQGISAEPEAGQLLDRRSHGSAADLVDRATDGTGNRGKADSTGSRHVHTELSHYRYCDRDVPRARSAAGRLLPPKPEPGRHCGWQATRSRPAQAAALP